MKYMNFSVRECTRVDFHADLKHNVTAMGTNKL